MRLGAGLGFRFALGRGRAGGCIADDFGCCTDSVCGSRFMCKSATGLTTEGPFCVTTGASLFLTVSSGSTTKIEGLLWLC